MSVIASHTELTTNFSPGEPGFPLISVLGPDSWLYALNGHSPDFPRTLTVTRTRPKVGSNKYGWKFVFSVAEEDETGAILPQPHVLAIDFRATKGGASGPIAIHALMHLCYTAVFSLASGLTESGAVYNPGSISEDVLTLGYSLPPGNFKPVSPV